MLKGDRGTFAAFGHRRCRVAVALAVLVCVSHLAADNHVPQAAQQPTFSSRVTLVPLDVRVIDRNGNPVTDLTKEDFTILEDGVPQQISHFERQVAVAGCTNAGTPPPVLRNTTAPELRSQDHRVFVIVMDGFSHWLPHAPFGRFEAVIRFLRERLGPQDYAGFCAWGNATDITTDHEAVAQVVERLREYQASVEKQPGLDQKLLVSYVAGFRPESPEMQAQLDAVFHPATLGTPAKVPLVLGRDITRLLAQKTENFDAFLNLSNDPNRRRGDPFPAGQPAPTRLALIIANTTGRWNVYSALEYLRSLEGEKHLILFSPLDNPAIDDDRDLARIASDARVVIHIATSGAWDPLASMSSKQTAELTGGHAFLNQYPDRAFARIEEATRAGYLLGYYPSNRMLDGRYRNIRVNVKRPRGATVMYRHSYRASAEPTRYDHRQFIAQDRIIEAGQYAGEIPAIKVTLRAVAAGGTVRADASIDLSGIDLAETGGRHEGTVELAFFCADSKERLVAQLWHKMDLKLKEATYQTLLTDGLRHTVEIPVPKTTVRYVKVVVYDYQADRLGSAIVRVQ